MSSEATICTVCGNDDPVRILTISGIPVFCNIQLDSREEALCQPSGDMNLEYCERCSHLYNSAFDESLLAYSESYENSLHFSAIFSRFAENLAERLVQQYALRGKKILDIGCGKGDFLALICELGANAGYGFDKSYEKGRANVPAKGSVEYFQDFFSDEYSHIQPDFVACRHVLEHIPEPGKFLKNILSAVGQHSNCDLYFEVPNVLFTIRDMGIWDIIYEHCQYFSPQSLTQIFAQNDVEVDSVYDCFGGQFLALEGNKRTTEQMKSPGSTLGQHESIANIANDFEENFRTTVDRWQTEISDLRGSAIVWGAGSKGTTFLNMLDQTEAIDAIVDINPNKQGKFVPCTGHPIIAPKSLPEMNPEHIFVMNPMYKDEISTTIRELGVNAKIHVVE